MPVESLSANVMQSVGNYDLVEKIAEGGMGTVYRGRHRTTGEIVAVKIVAPHLISNPVVLKRFEQEYNVARLIDHPNIVKAIDFGREGDLRYLVMEYVEGESLGQRLERDGRMGEAEAIHIISQIAEGLHNAHRQGMIHRDVKPDNILITSEGIAKLTDLGLVKELETDLNLTRTGRGLGTPHFMSPEQFRNAKKADARCDIYSLGATLYMMVTGELPFQSNGPLDAWMKKINNEIDPPRKRVSDLSERIDWAIRRAISPDPQSRPENCREFIEDLTGHSTQKMIGTDPNVDTGPAFWYMLYTDDSKVVHTVKGTVKALRRSLREDLHGDIEAIRIAPSKEGPFQSLRHYPEFRDLVIQPAKVAPQARGSDGDLEKTVPRVPNPAPNTPKANPIKPATHAAKKSAPTTPVRSPATPADGPAFNLAPRESDWGSPEVVRAVGMLFLFGCLGAAATFVGPTLIRYIRFFEW